MRKKLERPSISLKSPKGVPLNAVGLFLCGMSSFLPHAAYASDLIALPPASGQPSQAAALLPLPALAQSSRTGAEPRVLEDAEAPKQLSCPSGPKPPDPTIEEQMAIVDALAPKFAQQERRYPTVPHLDPKLVAESMINGEYLDKFSFVIAHRGVHSESGYTENGLSGIWRAYQAGSDGVELDIKTDCQGNTLLGHDFAIGRELNVPTFDLYENFPSLDPSYADGSKWPFWTNNSNNDPNNPNRLTNYIGSIWNKTLNDQFDTPSIFNEGQITALQGMYYTAKYTPMMVWLDIKNSADLFSSAKEILQVRLLLDQGNTTLDYVGLKLGAGTLRDPAINFNPSKATNAEGLIYFAVLGLGDLDRVKADGNGNLNTGLDLYCNPDNGCVGIELAHKYENAPTQTAFDYAASNGKTQIASFHTVPQYDWANFIGQESTENGIKFVRNFNRTFPRTDGSCCFALEDSLNIGLEQSEVLDRRGSVNWNLKNFNTITSDDANNLLRRLSNAGFRQKDIIKSLGGNIDFSYPTQTDGLYALFDQTHACYVSFTAPGEELGCNQFSRNALISFSLSPSGDGFVQFSNTSGDIVIQNDSSLIVQPITQDSLRNPSEFSLSMINDLTGTISSTNTSAQWLVGNSGNVSLSSPGINGTVFNIIPIRQAQLESDLATGQTENRIGPAGSVLWCDEGEVCGATHSPANFEQIAYGVDGKWAYKYAQPVSVIPFQCSVATFGTDPAPGQNKACYRQPYYGQGRISSQYGQPIAENYGLPIDTTYIFYGHLSSDLVSWKGNFGVPSQLDISLCENFAGAPDPAPGLGKACRVIEGPSPDLPNFAYCGSDQFSGCLFSTPHSVALQYSGKDGVNRYTYKTFSNGLRCSPDEFGVTAFSPSVRCFARVIVQSDPKVTNFTYCNSLGEECLVNQSLPGPNDDRFLAAYADNTGLIYYKLLQGSFKCNLETFGQSGTPNPSAACYYRLY